MSGIDEAYSRFEHPSGVASEFRPIVDPAEAMAAIPGMELPFRDPRVIDVVVYSSGEGDASQHPEGCKCGKHFMRDHGKWICGVGLLLIAGFFIARYTAKKGNIGAGPDLEVSSLSVQ